MYGNFISMHVSSTSTVIVSHFTFLNVPHSSHFVQEGPYLPKISNETQSRSLFAMPSLACARCACFGSEKGLAPSSSSSLSSLSTKKNLSKTELSFFVFLFWSKTRFSSTFWGHFLSHYSLRGTFWIGFSPQIIV